MIQTISVIRRNRALLGGVTLTAMFAAMASHAAAQPAQPSINLNPSPLQQYGQALANDGITLNGRYNGEFAANPSGGERQGAEFSGELNLGADFDLDKLVGLNGGTIHVLFTDRAGNNLAASSINNSVSVQQIYGDGQTYQLTILSYEQKLFNDLIDFKVGRLDIAEDYVVSPFYCYFQSNATCGNPSFTGDDINVGSSYYPIAVWGGTATINVTPHVYVKGGIYQSAPQMNPDASHGFNWSTNDSDGFQTAGEVGYAFITPGAAQSNRYDVGVETDQTHYAAPFYNASSSEQFGRSIVYAQAQQLLYQPVANAPQGLYGFAVGMIGTSESRQPSNFSAELGAVYQGIIPSRPLDNAGFIINETHYNKDYLNYYYSIRTAEGGTQRPDANLLMMELNYTAQLTSWLNMTPNIQYIVNPDGLGGGLVYPKSNLRNAFVLGVQFNLDVVNLLGL